MALTDKSSIVVPKGFYGKANVLQGFNPQTENLVDLDVTRNTTATRVNEAGLIESVAANVPRRDFLNGGCGELLLEPQRTNLFLNSETGATQTINVTSGATYSVSFSGTGSITFSGGETGTLNGTGATAKDRVETQITPSSTSVTCTISGTVEYVNFEEGSYSTSWIETTASAVTRNQDVISASNIGSLLNDAEGGVFIEASWLDVAPLSITLSDSTNANRVLIDPINSTGWRYNVKVNGTDQIISTGIGDSTANKLSKIAIRYSTNDFVFYQDGIKEYQDASGTTFNNNTLNNFALQLGVGGQTFHGRIRQLVIFDKAPTDTELQAITTP